MRYEMKNFVKLAKSNVGPNKHRKDEWKIARKIARKAKEMQRSMSHA